MAVKRLPIYEIQPGEFHRVAEGYKYEGIHRGLHDGLHYFSHLGERELFAKRKLPLPHWHLRRGAWNYEFCRSVNP